MSDRTAALAAAICLLAVGVAAVGVADEPVEPSSSLLSKLDLEWYGYVKLDFAYDGSETTPGQFAKWAVPGADGGEVEVTLNQTRLGLRVKGSGESRLRGSGRVEIDLYGHVDDPDPRIRHAYVELAWPESKFDIIIGQTSDVISPLYPSTLNYTVAWWAGNIGFRRPQIRLTKRFEAGAGRELKLEGALTHNIYDTRIGSVSGEDAGIAAQGRVSFRFPGAGAAPVTLGVSGHRAAEKFPTGVTSRECDSWSANVDLSLPLAETVRFESELFTGKSLSPYLGGAGQGVSLDSMPGTDSLHGIHSRGGWVALRIVPREWAKIRFNVGFSVDDVADDDLSAGGRELNRSLFANTTYRLRPQMDLGLELSHWTTLYQERDKCEALRTQVSLIYRI